MNKCINNNNAFALGPIFEGMPLCNYSNSKVSWTKIMNDIVNFYAPAIPYNYLETMKQSYPGK